jgi:hypothetical protein
LETHKTHQISRDQKFLSYLTASDRKLEEVSRKAADDKVDELQEEVSTGEIARFTIS